jgi:hypothetical protein
MHFQMNQERKVPSSRRRLPGVAVMLPLLASAALLIASRNTQAQSPEWNGPWVGDWLKLPATNACGGMFSTGGIMILTLLEVSNIVTGVGGTTGHYCMDSGCRLLDYDDTLDSVVGTISGSTMNVILTAQFIDGSCAGGVNHYSITATNIPTTPPVIRGTMTQISGAAQGSSGPIFLVRYDSSTTTNHIVSPRRMSNGEVQMVFFGVGGRRYSLQASTNLTSWSLLRSFTYTNSPIIVSDTRPGNLPKRFYRVIPSP